MRAAHMLGCPFFSETGEVAVVRNTVCQAEHECLSSIKEKSWTPMGNEETKSAKAGPGSQGSKRGANVRNLSSYGSLVPSMCGTPSDVENCSWHVDAEIASKTPIDSELVESFGKRPRLC